MDVGTNKVEAVARIVMYFRQEAITAFKIEGQVLSCKAIYPLSSFMLLQAEKNLKSMQNNANRRNFSK